MKKEFEKKEYRRPEMDVVDFSQQSYMLCGSGEIDDETAQFHSPSDTRIG